MSVRYLGPNGPTYLEPTLDQPRWLFKITPTWIQTWQGVGWARVEGGGTSYEEAHGLLAPSLRGDRGSTSEPASRATSSVVGRVKSCNRT